MTDKIASDIYYELSPVFDSHKSFYGKARVHACHYPDTGEAFYWLISYGTVVAIVHTFADGGKRARVTGVYSATTLRHIREFLRQQGFDPGTKSDIVRDFYHREVCIESDGVVTYLPNTRRDPGCN